MFARLSNPGKAAVFYGVAFVLVVAVALADIPDEPTLLLATFMPAVAVVLTLLVFTRDGYRREGWAGLGLGRAALFRWPAALLAPLILMGGAYGVAWGSGALAPVDGLNGTKVLEAVTDALLSVAVGTVTFQLGEELGWSGYLLPRLEALGQLWASALRGLLHALWHFPLIFLTGAYLAEGDRALTLPLYVVTLTCAGFAYGYLRFSSASVWPPTIAHAAFNTFAGAFGALTAPADPATVAHLVGEGGLLTAIGSALLAVWAVWRLRAYNRARTAPKVDPYRP